MSLRWFRRVGGGYPWKEEVRNGYDETAQGSEAKRQAGAGRRAAQADDREPAEAARSELGKQAAKGRQRGGQAGRRLEDRNRQQLYEIAQRENVPGRSKMGKWDLIKAIKRSR
jgi:hypothetical protein